LPSLEPTCKAEHYRPRSTRHGTNVVQLSGRNLRVVHNDGEWSRLTGEGHRDRTVADGRGATSERVTLHNVHYRHLMTVTGQLAKSAVVPSHGRCRISAILSVGMACRDGGSYDMNLRQAGHLLPPPPSWQGLTSRTKPCTPIVWLTPVTYGTHIRFRNQLVAHSGVSREISIRHEHHRSVKTTRLLTVEPDFHPPVASVALPEGIQLAYVDERGRRHVVGLENVAEIDFGGSRPFRKLPAYRGQRNFPGWWWSATPGTLRAPPSRPAARFRGLTTAQTRGRDRKKSPAGGREPPSARGTRGRSR
jgi:hypothetical protein